jgi:hypothetical protein
VAASASNTESPTSQPTSEIMPKAAWRIIAGSGLSLGTSHLDETTRKNPRRRD